MAYDLITGDWQFQLGTYLIGPPNMDTTSKLVSGLGVTAPKTQDATLDGADGAYAGPDYASVRVVIIDAVVVAVTGCADADKVLSVMSNYKGLIEAWKPSVVDMDLYGRIPGWGMVKWTGRPRGFADDLSSVRGGFIPVQLTFVASDPTTVFV